MQAAGYAAAGFAALAGAAAIADRRWPRLAPWPLILILAIIAGAVCAALSLKG